MPSHARPRTAARAVPVVLLSAVALAMGGLAALPTESPRPALEVVPASLAFAAPDEPVAMPPRTFGRPVVKKVVPVKKPAPKRVSRKRVPEPPRARLFCPVAGGAHFINDWGMPRSGGRRHQGTDLLASYGTPVLAVTSGVVKTHYSRSGGISLYLRGDNGDEYYYAHNSRNVVSSGERVRAGEVIAYVGTSGNARGGPPHVHFERHPGGGRAVNPYPFVRRLC